MTLSSSLSVVVADDDSGILTILQRVLQVNGFLTFAASNGTDALRLVKEVEPALVILDVLMPGMDGISVCKQIRTDSSVPVLILTALEDESDAARALEAGADDYIRKPFGVTELVARVRAVLR